MTDAPLLILRSPDGTGSPEFISLASLSVTDKDESLMDEESLCQACHWALRLPGSGDVIKFACQTSTDYLDWIRVVHGLWR